MKKFLVLVFVVLGFQGYAQNKDVAGIGITGWTLNPGTFSWRGTNTFFDMTSWDSSPFTEGHLKQGSNFRMNYRLLYPMNYNTAYEPGYPLIVMFHGAGERANCWNGSCYYDTEAYNANIEPGTNGLPAPTATQLNNLLNNDHNLVHGGSPHLSARNLAAGKLPNDPTLNARAFPGFVLFPQMMNGWDGNYQNAIRIIRLLILQENIDPNRIYVHGLSNGGLGMLNAVRTADWLFAAAAPMSVITPYNTFQNEVIGDSLSHVPFWFFQGGQDTNPEPYQTENLIRKMKAVGMSVKYTLYPSLGHGVWNTAYSEPDFFSWLLSHDLSDIHVYFNNPTICGTTGAGAKLGLPQGFYAYQWERNGEIITDATSHIYIATSPGTYRARFSRTPNPTEAEWNKWSKPVNVTELQPQKAVIDVTGTTHLRGPGLSGAGTNTAQLRSAQQDDYYYWYKDGVLINLSDTLRNYAVTTTDITKNGAYTLVTKGFDNCPTAESDPVYLFFNNSAPVLTPVVSGFTGRALSGSSIQLNWQDVSLERGYEIWRRKLGQPPFQFVKRTSEDDVSFIDTNLEPNTTYEYKIRWVNNQGRSDYAPSNTINTNLQVTTLSDNLPPGPPQNLIANASGNRRITLTWVAPADTDIDKYFIYYGSDSIEVNAPATSYTFSSLPLNSTYHYTMKAVDVSGEFSSSSNQSTANTFVTGLFYKHSTGAWNDLDDPTLQATFVNPEFTGTVSTFSLTPRTQEDFFNFEYEGYFYVETAGTYQFRTNSDDGSKLWLNGVLIVDNDGLHGSQNVTSGNQTLGVGPQEIRVQYFENSGGQSLTVSYRLGTTGNFTTIPANLLRSGNPPPTPVPPAVPINLTAQGVSMTEVDLNWDYTGQNPNGLKVVVLGSSTAAGTPGPTAGNSWVSRLTTWLSSTTTGSSVTNLALGGFDTYDVMPTGSTPAPDATRNITQALSLNPHIIIVNLPTNDADNNIPLTTTMNNFRAIKALADARGIPMFITTSQPRNFTDQAKRELLQTMTDSIRTAFGNYVIDIYDELTDFTNSLAIKSIYKYSGDGIHLNDAGHLYIFERTRDKLLQYLTNFEVQRSLSNSGPFTLISRTINTDFHDTMLVPDTQYFYRVRSVNMNGTSAYTAVVSTSTLDDAIAPSQPLALTSPSKTTTNVALQWTASTDNVAVTGYQIWANGTQIATSPLPAYQASGLEPGTAYSFYVIAFDANGNTSLASNMLNVTTNSTISYFSKPTGDLTILGTWGTENDGSGASPTSFAANGMNLVLTRGATLSSSLKLEGAISKLIVANGATLNVDNALTARVEVQGTGVVNLNYAAQVPQFTSLAPTSTVNYNYSSPAVFIQQVPYGNLGLSNAGPKTLGAGTFQIAGNLVLGNGVSLKGAIDNETIVDLGGDVICTGTPGSIAADYGVTLNLTSSGTKNITTGGGTLDLYQINIGSNTSVNVNSTGSGSTLRLGSTLGGGLIIPNGRSLNLGSNTLEVIGAGTINGANQNGYFVTTGGTISVASSNSTSSNLYFDATQRTLTRLATNLSGLGQAIVRSPVNISDAVKVTRGTLNSNGNIRLLSTLAKTANIEEIENNGQITGNVTVERYIHAKRVKVFRYISSSVAGVRVVDWQQAFPISGPFPEHNNNTNPSLFYYGPTGWIPYPTTSNTEPIERGRGYSAYMWNGTTASSIVTTGLAYQGTIPFALNDPQPGDPNSGWSLLGNPYASTIAWNMNTDEWPGINNAGINKIVSVRHNDADSLGADQFKYYDASTGAGTLSGGRIAPGQAFWVQTTAAGLSLSITERAKVAAQQFHFREGTNSIPKLQLNLSQGNKVDPAFIVLTEVGTDNFDTQYDGIKRPNERMFNFSTLTGDNTTALAINNSSSEFCSKTVKLNLQNTPAGTYTLSVADAETFLGVGLITLKDKFANKTINLRSENYSFTVTSDPASSGNNRFEIQFDRPQLDLTLPVLAADVCRHDANVTVQNSQPGALYALVDESGNAITETISGNGDDLEFTINEKYLKYGANSFRVRSFFEGCTTGFLSSPAEFLNNSPAEPLSFEVSTCEGGMASLSVVDATPGAAYNWYTAEGTLLKDQHDATAVVGPITQNTEFFVSKNINGCESPRATIWIYPTWLDASIRHTPDSLSVTNDPNTSIQWLKDGVELPGQTQSSFTPWQSGVYAAKLIKGGCEVTTEPIHFDVENEVSVFPNPATRGEVTIRFRSGRDYPVYVTIRDLMGREVFSGNYAATTVSVGARLDLSNHLRSGVYFIHFRQNGNERKVRLTVIWGD